MALDFSGLDALKKYGISPDKPGWFQDYNGIYGGGQGDWYLSDPNTGYRALTQNDINSYVTQTQQQGDATQQYQRAWAQHNGAIPLDEQQNSQILQQGTNGFTGPSADYRLGSIGNGQFGWLPKDDARFIPGPHQTRGIQDRDSYDFRTLLSEMPGLIIPLVALTAGAASGLAAGGAGAAEGGGAAAGAGAAEEAAALGGGLGSSAPIAPGAAGAGAGGGSLAGGSEAGSLYGDAGNTGGGMWDMVDTYDPSYYDAGGNTDFFQTNGADAGNNFDPGYMYDSAGNYSTAPGTQVPTQGIDWQAVSQKYGPELAKKIYNQYIASKTSNGKGILDTISGDPLQAGFNSLPFLYSLYEANRQGNQINPILARVSGLADSAASNQNGLVASAIGPYDRETMAGRDAAMTDQALRGVRGSSFGDQALGNYDLTRARGRGELLGSTQAKSLGLQGDLLNSLLKGQTQAATSRNMLIGAGLSASGKLFQPQNDPFGLQNLLSLGNIFGNP